MDQLPSIDQIFSIFSAWLLRIGAGWATAAITLLAVGLAVIMHGTILWQVAGPQVPIQNWIIASILVPAFITPPIAGFVVIMAYRLFEAKAALAEAALTDSLTNVSNRRFFLIQAEIELTRARRHQTPLSMLMIDIDHFKDVNDTYGHSVGDKVLCAIASACSLALRSGDLFARFGGEEFVALLPVTSAEDASRVAEMLRAVVEQLDLKSAGPRLGVTTSIGVATLTPGNVDLQSILDEADRQLYQAKNSGRNRVSTNAPRLTRKVS